MREAFGRFLESKGEKRETKDDLFHKIEKAIEKQGGINSPEEIKERGEKLKLIEGYFSDLDKEELEQVMEEYGIKLAKHNFSEVAGSTYFSMNTGGGSVIEETLPQGYGLKGGAARAVLLRTLDIDPNYEPRDIDIIRTEDGESYKYTDDELCKKYMADDHAHGHGVEYVGDVEKYFDTRDFTINELLVKDNDIILTKECILDTIRRIIRVTKYEKRFFMEGDDDEEYVGPKMLAKAIRFYSEGIHRWGDIKMEQDVDYAIEERFVSPFWLALQMDKAFEQGTGIADEYYKKLKEQRQIPEHIKSAEDAARYLYELLRGDTFYYRYAPVEQYKKEEEWIDQIEDEYEHLPKQVGHGKSKIA